ncbi:MAG: hypothetical protein GVY18_13710 [Bacteroidetes bacterium]|jgi:hypothetical protein|nr:hypothetical protein [Bacteroidota bacterium]
MPGIGIAVSPVLGARRKAAWVPSSTDLKLWTRLDRENYTIDTGITALQNEGDLGGTFDQATGSQQPTEATLGGRGAAKFTEADSQDLGSSLAASAWRFLHDGTGMRAMFVIEPSATAGAQTIISTLVATSTRVGFELLVNPGNGNLDVIVGNGSGTFVVASTTSGITANTKHLLGIRLGSGETNEYEVWLDGTLKDSGALVGTPDSGDPQMSARLGSRGGIYYDGKIAETVAWSAYGDSASFQDDMQKLSSFYDGIY